MAASGTSRPQRMDWCRHSVSPLAGLLSQITATGGSSRDEEPYVTVEKGRQPPEGRGSSPGTACAFSSTARQRLGQLQRPRDKRRRATQERASPFPATGNPSHFWAASLGSSIWRAIERAPVSQESQEVRKTRPDSCPKLHKPRLSTACVEPCSCRLPCSPGRGRSRSWLPSPLGRRSTCPGGTSGGTARPCWSLLA